MIFLKNLFFQPSYRNYAVEILVIKHPTLIGLRFILMATVQLSAQEVIELSQPKII
jgi:hypothetical protein